MQKFKLDKEYNKIHFIGIGGVSMNALALLLNENGFSVQGSDNNSSSATQRLLDNGIHVFIGHDEKNITDDVDLVVYTAAIKDENSEFAFAKNNNIEIIDRACLLGMILKNYGYPIAVAGTHGKSTTTSIISTMFLNALEDPTISVGGNLKEIDGNLRIGSSEYFIFEACEYFDSFLKFYPKIACILNVELDHVDYFSDINEVYNSFNRFSKNLPDDGTLVINKTIENYETIIQGVKCEIFTFGDNTSRVYADNIVFDDAGYPTFDVIFDNKLLRTIKIAQVGMHNILNTLCAISVAICTNIDLDKAFLAVNKFTGIDRRFQIKGKFNEALIIDDYAHHPTEISFALNAQKNLTKGTSYVVFQPHTYTRTKNFLDEFAKALMIADVVILVDIFAAREKNEFNISSKDILDILIRENKKAYFFTNDEVVDFAKNVLKEGDSLITMGAGDVYKIGDSILENR